MSDTGKRIFICSPLRAYTRPDGAASSEAANARYALLCGIQVAALGHTPVIPHIFLTAFLNDGNASHRALGRALGCMAMQSCDELWVFGDVLTDGMFGDIEFSQSEDIQVCYVKEDNLEGQLIVASACRPFEHRPRDLELVLARDEVQVAKPIPWAADVAAELLYCQELNIYRFKEGSKTLILTQAEVDRISASTLPFLAEWAAFCRQNPNTPVDLGSANVEAPVN